MSPTVKTGLMALAIVLGFLALIGVGVLALTTFPFNSLPLIAVAVAVFVIGLFASLLLALVGWIAWHRSQGTHRPKCRKWWAKVFLRREIRERKKCYGLVTRTARTDPPLYFL
jgi:hypothetical protein